VRKGIILLDLLLKKYLIKWLRKNEDLKLGLQYSNGQFSLEIMKVPHDKTVGIVADVVRHTIWENTDGNPNRELKFRTFTKCTGIL
jgi:hypothetical protein